jgi:sulfatase maturation enzyme AslB (radical SAM superfamily)
MHIDANGDVNLCFGTCWTSLSVGNVLKEDPWVVWRGAAAAQFRRSILDQSFQYCTNCRIPELLDTGVGPTQHDLSVIDCLVLAYDHTCNISCPSCRIDGKKFSPLAKIIQDGIINSDIFEHVRTLSMFGSGEPLVSPLFWYMLEHLKSANCHPELNLNLCTNGLLLTEKNLARIKATNKPISGIEISIDAATKDTYGVNRQGGRWSDLLANLAHLATSGIPLRFNFVVQANNFQEMPAFVDLALKHNATYVRFDALNDWGTFTKAEYRERAVHFPTHPWHAQFKTILEDPKLKHPNVFLAQLSEVFILTLSPLQTIHKIKANCDAKSKIPLFEH